MGDASREEAGAYVKDIVLIATETASRKAGLGALAANYRIGRSKRIGSEKVTI
jgi:hypothetical protein